MPPRSPSCAPRRSSDGRSAAHLPVRARRPAGAFAKALASAADAVVIDLEDAVLPAAKAAARAAVAAFLAAAADSEVERIVVRINDESAPGFDDDLAMLATRRVRTVMLPKAERVQTLARLHDACPGIAILVLIETARGVLACEALAAAPGVQRLVFGTIDFALDVDLWVCRGALDPVASRLAIVSRAAASARRWPASAPRSTTKPPCSPIWRAPVPSASVPSCASTRSRSRRSTPRCVRPRPNRTRAQRVLDAASASGGGAVQLDGRMVDKPVIERARRLIERSS